MPAKSDKPRTRTRKVGGAKKTASKKKAANAQSDTGGPFSKELQDLRSSLEYEIAGRDVRMTISDKRITVSKWGLRKSLQYGGRVIHIVQRIQELIPDDQDEEEDFLSSGIIAQVLSYISEDVLDIIGGSITDPFQTAGEAIEWLDQEASIDGLIALGHAIYELNFQGENGLGKRMDGLTGWGEKLRKAVAAKTP